MTKRILAAIVLTLVFLLAVYALLRATPSWLAVVLHVAFVAGTAVAIVACVSVGERGIWARGAMIALGCAFLGDQAWALRLSELTLARAMSWRQSHWPTPTPKLVNGALVVTEQATLDVYLPFDARFHAIGAAYWTLAIQQLGGTIAIWLASRKERERQPSLLDELARERKEPARWSLKSFLLVSAVAPAVIGAIWKNGEAALLAILVGLLFFVVLGFVSGFPVRSAPRAACGFMAAMVGFGLFLATTTDHANRWRASPISGHFGSLWVAVGAMFAVGLGVLDDARPPVDRAADADTPS